MIDFRLWEAKQGDTGRRFDTDFRSLFPEKHFCVCVCAIPENKTSEMDKTYQMTLEELILQAGKTGAGRQNWMEHLHGLKIVLCSEKRKR